MRDKYGRFIDDGWDYIISQAIELVFKRDKEFGRWVEQERNAGSNVERTITRTESAGSASLSGPQRDERGKRPRAEVVGRDANRISTGQAAILSIVESCRRLKFSVRDYLASILPGLADLPVRRLSDPISTAWVAQHVK